MVGVIIGSMIFGYLSDSYGRRRVMLIALVLCILCMVATSFTQSIYQYRNFFNKLTE
jgi:MFS family permease